MNTEIETNYQPRITSADLTGNITAHLKELAEATDTARLSDEMRGYLETYSRFHQYSIGNVWCILMTYPQATVVAGFNKWRSLNRFVKKGEKGIPILAPLLCKEEPDNENSKTVLRGFKVVYVFDVSQTEGEPLPEPPNWKSPEQNLLLFTRLVTFAEGRGISVTIRELAGETQGVSRGGAIEIDPSAGTKTLIHEIAHELMHRGDDRPISATIRELEAESVAWVVGRHFGLDELSSPNYIALHGATSEMIMAHLERIGLCARQIIEAIEVITE